MAPGASVSEVARRNGVAPNLLFRWRRLMSEGGTVAVNSNESVVGASEVLAVLRSGSMNWSAFSVARPWKSRSFAPRWKKRTREKRISRPLSPVRGGFR